MWEGFSGIKDDEYSSLIGSIGNSWKGHSKRHPDQTYLDQVPLAWQRGYQQT